MEQVDDVTMGDRERVWHVLDVGSIWMKEFASALSTVAAGETICWAPQMSKWGAMQDWERREEIADPPLSIRRFPLQRGYARDPLSWLLPFEGKLLRRLRMRSRVPAESPLICTTPFYAPVAEGWPGPVIYYATDLTSAYEGLDPVQVNRLDQRMCRVASAVCPNSERIASYFVEQAECDPGKITVVPNATRQTNLAPAPLLHPAPLPENIAHLSRPVMGVIGNLAGNMDWQFVAESLRQTPEVTWVFVGPWTMPMADRAETAARKWVLKHAHFTGAKPYGELQAYARAFDVAILPYQRKEPTYSGSSTRFYEHLAACRPMIATRGFAELLEKPPLVTLVDTPAELRKALLALREAGFCDGFERDRWLASKAGTWHVRAKALMGTISKVRDKETCISL